MQSIMGMLGFGTGGGMMEMGDKLLAKNLFLGASGAIQSTSALAAASNNPDLRRLFKEYLAESFAEQESLATYMSDQGWMKPFETPDEQLSMAVSDADSLIAVKA